MHLEVSLLLYCSLTRRGSCFPDSVSVTHGSLISFLSPWFHLQCSVVYIKDLQILYEINIFLETDKTKEGQILLTLLLTINFKHTHTITQQLYHGSQEGWMEEIVAVGGDVNVFSNCYTIYRCIFLQVAAQRLLFLHSVQEKTFHTD